jgi:lactate dehydrogenase-like 2-hydroxyacid dehydrogenase
MSAKPPILVVPRGLGALADLLEQDYAVYRFWEGPPTDVAPLVRAIVVRGSTRLDPSLVDSLPNLGLVAYFSAGYESFDADWAQRRGIVGTHAQQVNAEDTADMAIGLIYGLVRNVVAGDRLVRSGGWQRSVAPSRSIGGLKVGIVGLGAIGEAVAARCDALKMVPTWWGPRDKPQARWPRAESLLDLARDNDVLVVTAKLDETSRGLITRDVIEALGPQGRLINIARGQLVDQPALIAALKEGRLGGAGLDVYEVEPTAAELWADVPNTVLTPHIGGSTHEAIHAMTLQLMENLAAFHAGRPPPNRIPAV